MKLNRTTAKRKNLYKERILQFGEGNFLRSFVDWMIDIMNEKANFNSGVVVVQPIQSGMTDKINEQEGLYHVCLRGMKDGKPIEEYRLIDCIQRAINPYSSFESYSSLAESSDLRFIISNTTEAGIAYNPTDQAGMTPPSSFPAKITDFLYRRFKHFNGATDKGLILICCELIDHNADKLKEIVTRYSKEWNLEPAFIAWVNQSCAFCNSLVDRIVPGFPKDEITSMQKILGYEDQLLTVGEYFHLWVIEAPKWVKDEFPAQEAGLDVRFVDDMTAYRERKVRVLNGAHTGTVAISLLSGIETVRESIEEPVIGAFMRKMIYEEVLLPLKGDPTDLKIFADRILERFYNPYIRHQWTSIALNSLSKWVTRDQPSLLDYYKKTHELPPCLTLSLAALLLFFRGHYKTLKFAPQDDEANLIFMKKAWDTYEANHSETELVNTILKDGSWWTVNLSNEVPPLANEVARLIKTILHNDIESVVKTVLNS